YIVETGSADGVILNQTKPDDPRIRYMQDHGFPFATHGRTSMGIDHPYYDFDNGDFASKAAQVLHRHGRRCLALLGPPHDRHYGLDTFLKAREAAAELDLDFCEIKGVYSSDALGNLQAAASAFLARHPNCDGFVCLSDAAALAVTSALTRAGKEIGKDVEVIVKGSRLYLGMVHPAIIVIEEDSRRGAAFLSRAVLQAIRSPEEPPMQEVELPDFSRYL
ncbi:MAG: substrate-binding domain-containing protein, partial [Pseudomonadota bacterium]